MGNLDHLVGMQLSSDTLILAVSAAANNPTHIELVLLSGSDSIQIIIDNHILQSISKGIKSLNLAKLNIELAKKNLAITEIGKGAFANSTLERISIPETVTKISDRAFAGCSKLKSVHLPAGIVKIGKRAFANSSIKSIAIPAGVAKISDRAFANCPKLTSVTLPSGITEIGKGAFRNSGITGINIPKHCCPK